MKTLTHSLWILWVCTLASCVKTQPDTPPPVTVSSKPPVVASAVTSVDEARVALKAAEDEAEKTRANLEKTRENLAKANSSLRSTVEQAAKLAKQKSATEIELVDLYNRMVEQEKAYTDLTRDFDTTKTSLAAERAARGQLAAKLTEAERKAALKDAEAAELRRLLDTSESVAALNAKAAQTERQAAADATAKADTLRGHVRAWRNVALVEGALLLLILITFVAKVSGRLSVPL